MKRNLFTIAGAAAILTAFMVLAACGNGAGGGDDPGSTPEKPEDTLPVTISGSNGTLKWGTKAANNQTATSNKLTVSVNTQLEGEKTYAWTGMAGTNPGNSNEYTMVGDDENQTVTCAVTIGAESKSASVTVQPVWANLNPLAGGLPFENRSTSKSDADMTSEGYYADMLSMTPQKIATGQWNASKTENEIKDKVATYPVKKIVVIESGSTSYANGIIYLPYHYLFDSDSAGTTMGDLNTQYKAAYASLVVFAKQQGIRLAAVYYPKTDIRG